MPTWGAHERMVSSSPKIGMQHHSSYSPHRTPRANPEDAFNGCYAFSPSAEAPSSRVSVMSRDNGFDYYYAPNGNITPGLSSPYSIDRATGHRATPEASSMENTRPRCPRQGTQHRLVTTCADESSNVVHSDEMHDFVDGVVASSAASPVTANDVITSPSRLGSNDPYYLQASSRSLVQESNARAGHPYLTRSGAHKYPSEGTGAFTSTDSTSVKDALPAATAKQQSFASLSASPEDARQPPSSSTSSTVVRRQARNSDVVALRSQLNALLLQQAFTTLGAASHCDATVSGEESAGGPRYSPSLHGSRSRLRTRYNDASLNHAGLRAASFQGHTSHSHGQLSAEMSSPPARPTVSSFVTPPFEADVSPSLGRMSEPPLYSVAEHQQLPQPPLMCASEASLNSTNNRRSDSSRLSQNVRQARAQQAFDTQAGELEQQLEEQLGNVFALMRQIMVLDARLAAGPSVNGSVWVMGSVTDTLDYREVLVGRLEESEEAVVSTSLRFVALANRHALEWINQGHYSAALQLLQRTDGLLSKDAGRLFRYLPDPVEVDVPKATSATGERTAPFDRYNISPAQQASAASAWSKQRTGKGSTSLTASGGSASICHNSIQSDTGVRSMYVPYFSPEQEPRRLRATAAVEHNFGVYHFKLGEYTLASSRFARTAAIEEELKAPGIGITYFNMAQTQHRLRQCAEALQYAEMAEEAVERQVFLARDEATQMRRRIAQGCACVVDDFSGGAHAAGSGEKGEGGGNAAVASISPVSRSDSSNSAKLKAAEEKALVPLWLRWRESVCFMSYVKQTHADWLGEMGHCKEAHQQYRQAHDWLLTICRLAPEEVERAQLLKQCMANMKKHSRREIVEAELYHHPLRRSCFSSNGALSLSSHPSKGGKARVPSAHHARTHQRRHQSAELLSAAVPIARGLSSPLQSTVVTSVLPHAVEVADGRPSGPPIMHAPPFLQPPASSSLSRSLTTAHTRRRQSSASAALYSLYGPRRTSAPATSHPPTTTAAEQDVEHVVQKQPVQREPLRRQQKHGNDRPSSGLSTRVPILPPDRCPRRRTTTENHGAAASLSSKRRITNSVSHDNPEWSPTHATTHLPLRASSVATSANRRASSQRCHELLQESAMSSSTPADSSVERNLVFEVDAPSPEPILDRFEKPHIADAPGTNNVEKFSADASTHRSGFDSNLGADSADASVSNCAGLVSCTPRISSSRRNYTSRAPGDLTWCVTVLQAFLRPRCAYLTPSDTEMKGNLGETPTGDGEALQSLQMLSPSGAGTVKSDSPSYAADIETAAVALSGEYASSSVFHCSLSPKSASVALALKFELDSVRLFGTGASNDLVPASVGGVCGHRDAAQSFLPATTLSSPVVALVASAEDPHSFAGSALATEARAEADSHLDKDRDSVISASAVHETFIRPARQDASVKEHEGFHSPGRTQEEDIAATVLMKRDVSPILYISEDDETASRSAAPEKPLGSKSSPPGRYESGDAPGGCVEVDGSAAASEHGATCAENTTDAASTKSHQVSHEEKKSGVVESPKSNIVNDIVLEVEPLDTAVCHRTPVSVDVVVAGEQDSCSGGFPESPSTVSTQNAREKVEEEAPRAVPELQAGSPQTGEMAAVESLANGGAHNNTQEAAKSDTHVQTVATPPRSLASELHREGPEDTHLSAARLPDSPQRYHCEMQKVANTDVSTEDVTEAVTSAEEGSCNPPNSSCQPPASLIPSGWQKEQPPSPRVPEEKRDEDQLHSSAGAGLAEKREAGVCTYSGVAPIGPPDGPRKNDVSEKTKAGEAGCLDLLPQPLVSSAGAEDHWPSIAEDAALRDQISTCAPLYPTRFRPTPDTPEEQNNNNIGGMMAKANGATSRVTEILKEKMCDGGEEGGNALPASGKVVSFNEETTLSEREEDTTGVMAAAVIPQRAEAQDESIARVEMDSPHPHCRDAVRSSPSPNRGSNESSGEYTRPTATLMTDPHEADSGAPWARDRKSADVSRIKRVGHVNGATESQGSGGEIQSTMQPLATSPSRCGRTFVFVPHKLSTSRSAGLAKVNRPVHNDVASKDMQLLTAAVPQLASVLDMEGAEDGAAKSLLRLTCGSRTSGSLDAPLSFKEDYYYPAALQPYTTTDDETLGRHTASTGSTATPLTQIRDSFWRSTYDRNDIHLLEGGPSVKSGLQRVLKLEAVDLVKVASVGMTGTPPAAVVVTQQPLDPTSMRMKESPDGALVRVTETPSDVEEVKVLQRAQKELLSIYGIDITEDLDAPSQRTTNLSKPRNLPHTFSAPCSSPIAGAVSSASNTVSPADMPEGSAMMREHEMQLASSDPPIESATAFAEVSETTTAVQSQRIFTPKGNTDDAILRGIKDDAGGARLDDEGGALVTLEGGKGFAGNTIRQAREVKNAEHVHRNVQLNNEGAHDTAVALSHPSAGSPALVSSLATPHGALSKQELYGLHLQTLAASRWVMQPGLKKTVWGNLEVEEAQRRYIRNHIMQEEAATVIQKAWRARVAAQQRRKRLVLW